ncbi:MAG: hypothetical protein NUV50_07235 [Rhodospirillales bacterium]|nr:hypothetical protein [Rhodospirillales bacterium]
MKHSILAFAPMMLGCWLALLPLPSSAQSSAVVFDASSPEAIKTSAQKVLKTISLADAARLSEDLDFLDLEAQLQQGGMSEAERAKNLLQPREYNYFSREYQMELAMQEELRTREKKSGQTPHVEYKPTDVRFYGASEHRLFESVASLLHGQTPEGIHKMVSERLAKYEKLLRPKKSCKQDWVGSDAFVYGLALRNPAESSALKFKDYPYQVSQVDVGIPRGNKPIFLVLMAREPTVWNIALDDGAKLDGILLWGFARQVAANVPRGVPVHMFSTKDGNTPCGYDSYVHDAGPDLMDFDAFFKGVTGRSLDRVDAHKEVGQIRLARNYDRPNALEVTLPQEGEVNITERWEAPRVKPDDVISQWAFEMPAAQQLDFERFLRTASIEELVRLGYLRPAKMEEFESGYRTPALEVHRERAKHTTGLKNMVIQVPAPNAPLYRVAKPFPILKMRTPVSGGASILVDKAEDLEMIYPIRPHNVLNDLNLAIYVGDKALCSGKCVSVCYLNKGSTCSNKGWD